MVILETMCHSVWGYAVESKGAGEEWMVDQVLDDLQTVGLANERIIVKSDQENSYHRRAKGTVQSKASIRHGPGEFKRRRLEFQRQDRKMHSRLQRPRENFQI